jgi:hypothetical protein
MRSTTIRRPFLTLAALAAIAVAGPTAGASAATKGGMETAPSPAESSQTVVALEAGSTGQGPADDKECEKRAVAINSWSDQANADVINGDAEGAEESARNVEALEDQALDRGCFILY